MESFFKETILQRLLVDFWRLDENCFLKSLLMLLSETPRASHPAQLSDYHLRSFLACYFHQKINERNFIGKVT